VKQSQLFKMFHRVLPAAVLIQLVAGFLPSAVAAINLLQQPGFVRQQFLYERASFPSCHASTIVESQHGLVAAFFGGTDEGEPDVGIWVSRFIGGQWTAPQEVANGFQPRTLRRYPCWNPVLFQPHTGPLLLFYKVGPNPRKWWGMLKTSNDGGQTWSQLQRLPNGILGPVKNKPIQTSDGMLLCGSSTEHDRWRLHMEITPDHGLTWWRTAALNDGKRFSAIQPALLAYGPGRLQLLCRTKQRCVAQAWSQDNGRSWTPLEPTSLPNPDSGLDAVMLKDRRALLVYNPTTRGRSPLSVAVSRDGSSWDQVLVLEDQPGEYSYPAVIQSQDGLVHVTYTWKRQLIRHAIIDPAKLQVLAR
jgi:predicted neuraminidase